jgi:DMSO/TMAO reductase YedYZ molybdopterin-dependent catalytic subunit
VIGNFGGVRLSDFLKAIGADPTARFVTLECADDYTRGCRFAVKGLSHFWRDSSLRVLTVS